MAMKARYTVINGEIIAEKRAGVRSLYVPDPLGSTRGLINNTQTQTDTFNYWPYGEQQSRTGATSTPFQFVGSLGYHLDSGQGAKTYVRARYLDTAKARWLVEDPLGLDGGDINLYCYVASNPTSQIDPSGRSQCLCGCGGRHCHCHHAPFLPPGFTCPPGQKPCYVTCYKAHKNPPAYARQKGCPAKVKVGVCASYCQGTGNSACPPGGTISITNPSGGVPPITSCKICDCGIFSGIPSERPGCWIDVWQPSCQNFPSGWYCVQCS